MRDLIRDSLDGERQAPDLDPAKARQFAMKLRELFPNLHLPEEQCADAAARALGQERWQTWKQSVLGALHVTVETGRRSRIAVAQTLRPLLETPMQWRFAAAPAMRGEDGVADPGWAQTDNPPHQPQVTVTVDEDGSERTLLATVKGLPAGMPAPLLLLYRLNDASSEPVALDATAVSRDGLFQYRAPIHDGEYAAVFGPR